MSKHGSPANRGAADAWYRRSPDPHKYPNGTYNDPRIQLSDPKEIEAYHRAYDEQEASGDFKDWG